MNDQMVRAFKFVFLTFIIRVPMLFIGVFILSITPMRQKNDLPAENKNKEDLCNIGILTLQAWYVVKFVLIIAFDIFYGFWNWIHERHRLRYNIFRSAPSIKTKAMFITGQFFSLVWYILGCIMIYNTYKDCVHRHLSIFVIIQLSIDTVLIVGWTILPICCPNWYINWIQIITHTTRVIPSPAPPSDMVQMNEVLFQMDDINKSCSICLNEYKMSDKVVKLACWHAFHRHCITGWINQAKVECPNCRHLIFHASDVSRFNEICRQPQQYQREENGDGDGHISSGDVLDEI